MNTAGRSIISGGIGLIAVAALGLTGCSPSEESAEFEDTEFEDTEAASTEEAAPGRTFPLMMRLTVRQRMMRRGLMTPTLGMRLLRAQRSKPPKG